MCRCEPLDTRKAASIIDVPMCFLCLVSWQGYGVAGVASSGEAEEVENSPALSLTLACLPQVCIVTKTEV